MISIYDRNKIVFNDGNKVIDFWCGADIIDFEDSFVLETQVAIDDITRGWIGDVSIMLSGKQIDDLCNETDDANDTVLYKDALCYRRTAEVTYPQVVTWKYMFMKY